MGQDIKKNANEDFTKNTNEKTVSYQQFIVRNKLKKTSCLLNIFRITMK